MSIQQASLPDQGAGSTRRDIRRLEKIRQIVEAATAVFLEDGYAGTSMDKIVEKSGVSKSTLYNYYQSKDEIFVDVMETHLGAIFENFEPAGTRAGELATQLRRVGAELLRIANAQPTIALFRITAAEAQRFPRLAHQFFEESFEQVIQGIAAMLERESAGAGLQVGDAKAAGEYFVDLLFGTAQLRVIYGTTEPMNAREIERRTERALDYFYTTYR